MREAGEQEEKKKRANKAQRRPERSEMADWETEVEMSDEKDQKGKLAQREGEFKARQLCWGEAGQRIDVSLEEWAGVS